MAAKKNGKNRPIDLPTSPKDPSENIRTLTLIHDDGNYIRTALVIEGEPKSVVLVDGSGKRLVQIDITAFGVDGKDSLVIDITDKDARYPVRALYSMDSPRMRLTPPKQEKTLRVDLRAKKTR